MARITVEDCLDNVENLFELVLVASKRARRLANGAEPYVEIENDKPTVVALREIANKSLKPDELKEEFIKSLQRHAEVDEPETAQPAEEVASDEVVHRQLTEEELLRALTSEAQRRAEPQPEDTTDYEE